MSFIRRTKSIDIKQSKCTKCKEYFPRTEEYFYKLKTSKDGMHSQCKECIRETSKKNRLKKRNHYIEYRTMNYQRNRKREDAQKKEWIKNNKEQHRKIRKEWEENNRDKIAEYRIQWNLSKKHEITQFEWEECLKYFNYQCAYCNIDEDESLEKFKQRLHKDHLDNKGANDLSNCVPACKSCNGSKRDKSLSEFAKHVNIEQRNIEKINNWINEDYLLFIKKPD